MSWGARGKWGSGGSCAGENRPEVGETPDGWGPPVREKNKKKWKRKGGRGSGSGGPLLGWLPGLAQLGCLSCFFVLNLFFLFLFCYFFYIFGILTPIQIKPKWKIF
jgi:hypothetical protein